MANRSCTSIIICVVIWLQFPVPELLRATDVVDAIDGLDASTATGNGNYYW